MAATTQSKRGSSQSWLVLEPNRIEKQYWLDLWRYRELFAILAWRDITVRYKQTFIGVARVLRGYTVAALENMALWHERDISHSSVERMMLPDCSVTLHFMLREMTEVVRGLGVYPENMSRNLNLYGGVVFSQRVLLALVESGLSREEAYRLVQRHAHSAWNTEGGDFRAELEADPEVTQRLTPQQREACFATDLHRAHLAVIWERLGI